MAVAFFLIVFICNLDLLALYPGLRRRARAAGIVLSSILQPPVFATADCPACGHPFPSPPTTTAATKLIVSTDFTPARRPAQPLLAARARSSWLWWGERQRRRGQLPGAAPRERLQRSTGLVQYLADLFSHSLLSVFLSFSFIVSHPPGRRISI